MPPREELSTAHPTKQAEGELPEEISDLDALIKELDPEVREKFKGAMARVVDSAKRRRRILSLVQDALSQLRLDMKYLAFDLEATRRERDDYRRQLEDRDSATGR